MRCGLYGKLPAKRDFVALGLPRDVLTGFETWLQQGVAASRARLGAAWQPAFLRAPIWRFWLGHEVCGATVLGAFMPSVDGVGRYFPLALLAVGAGAEAPAPPDADPHEAWMARAEDLLLSALDPGTGPERIVEALPALPVLSTPPADALPGGVVALGPAALSCPIAQDGPPAAFARLRAAEFRAGMSYWWTLGSAEIAPRALTSSGLPDPTLFAAMLTGRFETGAQG